MNCKKTEELATGYALNELSPDLAAEIKKHIASCAACSARVDEIKETLALLKSTLVDTTLMPLRLDENHRAALECAVSEKTTGKFLFAKPVFRIAAAAVLCAGLGVLLYFWKLHSDSQSIIAEIREREVAFSYLSENQIEARRAPETRRLRPETPATTVIADTQPFMSEMPSDFSTSVQQPPRPRATVPERLVARSPLPAAPMETEEEKPQTVTREFVAARSKTPVTGNARLTMSMGAARPAVIDMSETDELPKEFLQIEAEIMSSAPRQAEFNLNDLLGTALPTLGMETGENVLSTEFAAIDKTKIIMLVTADHTKYTDTARLLLEIKPDPSKIKAVKELGGPGRTQVVIDPNLGYAPALIFELEPENAADTDLGAILKLSRNGEIIETAAIPAKDEIAEINSAPPRIRLAYYTGKYAEALKKPDPAKQSELGDIIKGMQQLNTEYPDKFIISEILELIRSTAHNDE